MSSIQTTRIATLLLIAIFSATALAYSDEPSVSGKGKRDPDAIALMTAVENVRTQSPPFRVKGKFLQKERGKIISQNDFEVAFDGGRYRVQVTYPIPEKDDIIATSIFDGVRVLEYDPSNYDDSDEEIFLDPANAESHMFFDPRLIGISTSLCTDSRFYAYLSFHSASRIEFAGAEKIAESPIKIVAITERSGQRIQFWIDSVNSFRVVKHTLVYPKESGGPGSKTVTESEFWPRANDEWLPRKVRMVTYAADEGSRVIEERVLEFGKPLLPAHISPETWTLKGLGMPSDRVVVNPQTSKRIGYWDGEKLTLDRVEKPRSTGLTPEALTDRSEKN